ncbi:winged helix-turn-helix transcriptional regulator [Arthrobacter sp. BL-252-APC-1A]|nr:winged helix-turn-helix transcriptional regulator [Arthrobacter sp. BL-252-APC-1A]
MLFAGTAAVGPGERYEYQYGLETAHLLDVDWTAYAETLASLGNPVRLSILRAVLGGTETVAQLVEELGAGTAGQIYHHVNQLLAQGWLAAHARSRYRIPAPRVIPLLAILTAATGGN